MTVQIAVSAGSQHVMVYLPDGTYRKIEPNSQATVQLDGEACGIAQVGAEEPPPEGNDVKAFFIKVWRAMMDHIEGSPPPEEST